LRQFHIGLLRINPLLNWRLLATLVAIALTLMLAAPLAAAGEAPSITVSKTAVDAHEPFTISGSGFPANTPVFLAVYAPGVNYELTDYFCLYRSGGGHDSDPYGSDKMNVPFNAPVYGVKVTTDGSGSFSVEVALTDRGSHGVGSCYGKPTSLTSLPAHYNIYYRVEGQSAYSDSGQTISLNRRWSFFSEQALPGWGFTPKRGALIGSPGGKLVVAGAGFEAGTTLTFQLTSPYPLGSNLQNEYSLGAQEAGSDGTFEAVLPLPEGLYHSTGYVRLQAFLAAGQSQTKCLDLPLHIVRINVLSADNQPTQTIVPGAKHYLDLAGFTPGSTIALATLINYSGTSGLEGLMGRALSNNAGGVFYEWTAPADLALCEQIIYIMDSQDVWGMVRLCVAGGASPGGGGQPSIQILTPSLSANPDTAGAASEWTVSFTPSVTRAVYAGEHLEVAGPAAAAGGGPQVLSVDGLGSGATVTAEVYQNPASLRLTFGGGDMTGGQPVSIRVGNLVNPTPAGAYSFTLRYRSADGTLLASAQAYLSVKEPPPAVVCFVQQPPSEVAIGQPFTVAVAVYGADGNPATSGRVELALVRNNSYWHGVVSPSTAPVQDGLALFEGVTIGDWPGGSLLGDGFRLRAIYITDSQPRGSAESAPFSISGKVISRLLATSRSEKVKDALWPGKLPGYDAASGKGSGSLPPGELARVNVTVSVASGSWGLYLEGGPLDGELRLSGTGPQGELAVVTVSGENLPAKLLDLGPGTYNLKLILANSRDTYGLGDLHLVLRGDGQAEIRGYAEPFLRDAPAEVEVNRPFRVVLCVPENDGSTKITLGWPSSGTPAYEGVVRDSVAVFEGVTVPLSVPSNWSSASAPEEVSIYWGYCFLGRLKVKPYEVVRLVGHEGRRDVWNSSVGGLSSSAVIPPPGEGALVKQGRFAVFDWSFTALEGSRLLLAGNDSGTVPFAVYHGWTLELSRQREGGLVEKRTVTSETYVPAEGRPGEWLVEIGFGEGGLPPGTYGARLSLVASSKSYGASEVYLVSKGIKFTEWYNFPRPVLWAVDLPPLELDLPSSVDVPVGGEERIPVEIKTTVFNFSYFTIHYSLDPRAVEIVRVEPPAGTGNRVSWYYDWIGVSSPQGSQFTSGSPLFDLVVRVKQPGDWVLAFLGNTWNTNPESNFLEWYKGVGAAVTLRGVSPPLVAAPGAAQASPVAVDPGTGEVVLTLTVAGKNLGGAAKAVLTDTGGNSLELPVSVTGGTLATARSRIPAGLYALRLVDAAGNTLAALANQAVPPAVPLMYVERVDRSPQLPGKWSTHIWRVRNDGTTDGTALISFLFPGFYDQPRPILPEGARLIWSGQKAEPFGWLAYVAVPVPAGRAVNVAWSLRIPPEKVRFWGANPNAPVEVGDPIKLDASVVGAFSRASWEELKGASDEELVRAAEDLHGITEPLSPLFALSRVDLQNYFWWVSRAYPDLARRLFSEKELGLWSILRAAQEGSEGR